MCLPIHPFRVEREWEHAGLKCAVVQNREGQHRCGYVRVPPAHPLHGKSYDDCDVDVHGGLSFAQIEPCAHEDGTGWWLGFDCCHLGDAMFDPDFDASMATTKEGQAVAAAKDILHGRLFNRHDHYWTQPEVERETEQLAEQLAAVTASSAETRHTACS